MSSTTVTSDPWTSLKTNTREKMPFKSAAQRRLFHAARRSQTVRRKHGMSEADVEKMISHDSAGKLPRVAKRTRKALSRKRR